MRETNHWQVPTVKLRKNGWCSSITKEIWFGAACHNSLNHKLVVWPFWMLTYLHFWHKESRAIYEKRCLLEKCLSKQLKSWGSSNSSVDMMLSIKQHRPTLSCHVSLLRERSFLKLPNTPVYFPCKTKLKSWGVYFYAPSPTNMCCSGPRSKENLGQKPALYLYPNHPRNLYIDSLNICQIHPSFFSQDKIQVSGLSGNFMCAKLSLSRRIAGEPARERSERPRRGPSE